jgi:putative membrane protein
MLALSRTLLAHQRTLMAWLRTSASLISFGFTIYKFFEYLAETEGHPADLGRFRPRHFAMAMIIVGLSSLVVAIREYHQGLNRLREEFGQIRKSEVGKIAGLVAVLGLGLLLVVLFRF